VIFQSSCAVHKPFTPVFPRSAGLSRKVMCSQAISKGITATLKVLLIKRAPGQLSHIGGLHPKKHHYRNNVISSIQSLPQHRHCREVRNPGRAAVQGKTVSRNGKEPGRQDG